MGFVKMGNKVSSPTIGINDICVSTNFGVKLTLKDVRLVPDLHLNLLSFGKFDEEGCTSCFGEGCWKLTKGALVKEKGRKCCTLCKTHLHLEKGEINTVEEISMDRWHKRLDHMSEKRLQALVR